MGLILDSSVIVAAERRGHTVVQILEQIMEANGETDIGVSVVTIAELTHGAYRAKDEADRTRRLAFVEELCRDIEAHPLTVEVAKDIGRIEGQAATRGFALSFEDLAIGVTALQLGFDVATLNVKDFQRIPGLKVVTLYS